MWRAEADETENYVYVFSTSRNANTGFTTRPPDKYDTLGQVLCLEQGASVLDHGSGSAEMLCTWARDFGITGTGVDMSQIFSDQAKRHAESSRHF
ncbi:SAM-dependent methyltransferase [Martelella soudanensis]|uniref:SAM-dependent methyltransferase n=1 Tax=Martelella sp. NC20 TaxID=2740298 RepID=UPI0015DE0C98|nr:hypothetical protein [Martelella sp. NC20]